MTIRIDDPGIWYDGTPVIGQVDLEQEGELEYDEQAENAEDITSEVTYQFTGWTPRRFVLSVRIAEPRRGGRERYAHVKAFNKAYRGGNPNPIKHTLLGDMAEAVGLDSPVIIEGFRTTESTEDDSVYMVLRLKEEKPERVSLTTAPLPDDPDRPEEPGAEADLLGPANEAEIERLETSTA